MTPQFVEETLRYFLERCEIAHMAGGIPSMKLVATRTAPPPGYWHDPITEYWMPPNFTFDGGNS